ncbi:hypothetical protein GGX14DRAFT_559559 [Mycena pura]|uniref:Uncharacterized protein n=1 Tax=Mycena pura TaxID=153505 RepID=A0AAD6VV88_9AGAR|nr:hypothetical protein GGX14DRAFT_559559 [Mycena pura]
MTTVKVHWTVQEAVPTLSWPATPGQIAEARSGPGRLAFPWISILSIEVLTRILEMVRDGEMDSYSALRVLPTSTPHGELLFSTTGALDGVVEAIRMGGESDIRFRLDVDSRSLPPARQAILVSGVLQHMQGRIARVVVLTQPASALMPLLSQAMGPAGRLREFSVSSLAPISHGPLHLSGLPELDTLRLGNVALDITGSFRLTALETLVLFGAVRLTANELIEILSSTARTLTRLSLRRVQASGEVLVRDTPIPMARLAYLDLESSTTSIFHVLGTLSTPTLQNLTVHLPSSQELLACSFSPTFKALAGMVGTAVIRSSVFREHQTHWVHHLGDLFVSASTFDLSRASPVFGEGPGRVRVARALGEGRPAFVPGEAVDIAEAWSDITIG